MSHSSWRPLPESYALLPTDARLAMVAMLSFLLPERSSTRELTLFRHATTQPFRLPLELFMAVFECMTAEYDIRREVARLRQMADTFLLSNDDSTIPDEIRCLAELSINEYRLAEFCQAVTHSTQCLKLVSTAQTTEILDEAVDPVVALSEELLTADPEALFDLKYDEKLDHYSSEGLCRHYYSSRRPNDITTLWDELVLLFTSEYFHSRVPLPRDQPPAILRQQLFGLQQQRLMEYFEKIPTHLRWIASKSLDGQSAFAPFIRFLSTEADGLNPSEVRNQSNFENGWSLLINGLIDGNGENLQAAIVEFSHCVAGVTGISSVEAACAHAIARRVWVNWKGSKDDPDFTRQFMMRGLCALERELKEYDYALSAEIGFIYRLLHTSYQRDALSKFEDVMQKICKITDDQKANYYRGEILKRTGRIDAALQSFLKLTEEKWVVLAVCNLMNELIHGANYKINGDDLFKLITKLPERAQLIVRARLAAADVRSGAGATMEAALAEDRSPRISR